jgi:hypothetical protein
MIDDIKAGVTHTSGTQQPQQVEIVQLVKTLSSEKGGFRMQV